MDKIRGQLYVFFEEPFWVGVFERVLKGKLSVAKVTFGAEPRDYEVYDFILKNYDILQFSPAVETVVKDAKKNPKRMQREARKQLVSSGVGTRSQQALKLQQEEKKTERKIRSKEQKAAEIKRQFELRQQKKKEKHKGR